MWLVFIAMRRPITILVAVMAVALASIMAIRQMKVDIFPQLGAPAIYVAMSPTLDPNDPSSRYYDPLK